MMNQSVLPAVQSEDVISEKKSESESGMTPLTLESLLEAGVHFGHQNHRWNPKMSRYIFGERNGIHIIDLTQTLMLMERALKAIEETARRTGRILFVGTKLHASPIISEAAKRCAQYYINHRWLGGTLTNWKTIAASIQRLRKFEELVESGMPGYTKKEQGKVLNECHKLHQALGGIKNMGGLPDMLFVIDTNKDFIAVQEAKKLGIPIVAILDSNSDPDGIKYPIPGNDDATRAISFYCDRIAEAVLSGLTKSMSSPSPDTKKSPQSQDKKMSGHERITADTFKKGPKKDNRNAKDQTDNSSLNKEKKEKGKPAFSKKEPAEKSSAQELSSDDSSSVVSAQDVKMLRERTGAGFMDCKKALVQSQGNVEGAIDFLRKKGLSKAAEKAGREALQGLVALIAHPKEASIIELNCETDFVARNENFQALASQLVELSLKHKGRLEAVLEDQISQGNQSHTAREAIVQAVASIGENIALRRCAYLAAEEDEILGHYTHNALTPGKGQIGALILLKAPAAPQEVCQELARKLAVHIVANNVQAIAVDALDSKIVEQEKAIAREQAAATGKSESVIEKMIEGRLNKFYSEVVLLKQAFVMDQDKTVEEIIKDFEQEYKTTVQIKAFIKFKLGESIE